MATLRGPTAVPAWRPQREPTHWRASRAACPRRARHRDTPRGLRRAPENGNTPFAVSHQGVANGGVRSQSLYVRARYQRVADTQVRELHRPRQDLAMTRVDHASSSRLIQDERELLDGGTLAKLA